VLRLFQHYPWPGNVRQLFNVLRTAAVMAANEPTITREHLSDDFLEEARAAQPAAGDGATPGSAALPHTAPAGLPRLAEAASAPGDGASVGPTALSAAAAATAATAPTAPTAPAGTLPPPVWSGDAGLVPRRGGWPAWSPRCRM